MFIVENLNEKEEKHPIIIGSLIHYFEFDCFTLL